MSHEPKLILLSRRRQRGIRPTPKSTRETMEALRPLFTFCLTRPVKQGGSADARRIMNATGRPEKRDDVHAGLMHVVTTRQPQYLTRRLLHPSRDLVAHERLMVPLAADGETVDMLMALYLPLVSKVPQTPGGPHLRSLASRPL